MTRRPQEIRERGDHPSGWAAICSASNSGCSSETLRKWVCRGMVAGRRASVTSEERERLRRLERENLRLRRANETLKAAAAFFGRSWTPDRDDDCLHHRKPWMVGVEPICVLPIVGSSRPTSERPSTAATASRGPS